MAKDLRVRLHAPFRVFLLQAYQDCFALSPIFGRSENYAVRSEAAPLTFA